ncbi:MAG TPA: DUF6065 family protein [Dongiaceae bacterium]|nr:DUF6065 family protein [Dongiaceae bacterium]
MKLVFYSTGSGEVKLRSALPTRPWMDETSDAFAYRCLPLNIANAHGWEFLAESAFSARWDGGSSPGSVDIRGAAGPHALPTSIFGHGVLTFHVHGVFRTEPGWNLFVGGSPNQPKDGIYPLSGVIETDWAPYSFTMNWRFTRADHWISFDEGEPFCFVFPVQRGPLEDMQPEIRDMASDPVLRADFGQWGQERREFTDRLMVKDSSEARMRWQKRYYRGLTMQDEAGAPDHQARLRLPEFTDRRAPRSPAAAARGLPLPAFFREVVPLSRAAHEKLGLHGSNYAFAATTPLIPLAAVEFAHAGAGYPLAFSATNPPRPLCVVGGLPGLNLHVDAAGNWRSGYYIPAAVRRFPFIVLPNDESAEFLSVGVEDACALLDPAAPDKLFEDGGMTALCRERVQLAAKVASEFDKTDALCHMLTAQDLLMPVRNVAPHRMAVRSIIRELRVVDPERLRALPDNLRAEWQANGWLAALEAHAASARNWARLLAQEDEMSATLAQPRDPA